MMQEGEVEMEKKYLDIGRERLAYLDEGEGKVVLLLHGNMSSSLHFVPLIDRLKDRFRCIAPDLRGFGDSSYHQPYDSFDELAEDIGMFLDQMRISEAYVCGWSAGGAVAMKLSAMYPAKVLKLFLMEGASHKGYPIFQKDAELKSTLIPYPSKDAMGQDPMQVLPMLNILGNHDAATMAFIWKQTIYTVNDPPAEYAGMWIGETLKQRCLADLDWALATLNMSAEQGIYSPGDNSLSLITCPVALTSGDKDLVVPPYMVMENVSALGSKASLLSYENCGHSPLVDCPDRLARDAADFFLG